MTIQLKSSHREYNKEPTTSIREGVAGGSNGTLTYNVNWKFPKAGVKK